MIREFPRTVSLLWELDDDELTHELMATLRETEGGAPRKPPMVITGASAAPDE